MKKILIILVSFFYAQEITNITLEQRTDGSGIVDVCYDLTGTEDFSLFFITAEINFDGEWLPVSGASGEIGPTIEVGTSKCFEWNVRSQYPEKYSDNVQVKIHADSDTGMCLDVDGNQYETVLIGDQLWMAENLRVTHYRNGSEIPTNLGFGEESEWYNNEEGAYVFYNDDLSNVEIYGNLYNWYAIDDSRGICPIGWHVPTDTEFTVLTDYLGGESVAGGKMKETGFEHWNSPNTGGTNESGFTGLPGGERRPDSGGYDNIGGYGYFWSSTENDNDYALRRGLLSFDSGVYPNNSSKQGGFSIRCLKD